jgi:hypothetical protein
VTRRRAGALVLVLVVALAGSACGRDRVRPEDALRAATARVNRQARSIVYRESSAGGTVEARVALADDFRYRAAVDVDGALAFEEIVNDDALAVRVVDVGRIGRFLRSAPASGPLAVPTTGGWVVDPMGAPELHVSTQTADSVTDPVLDAIEIFDHVQRAVDRGKLVRFDPEDLQYRPQEDPFPRPESDVIRYDLLQPRLPRPEGLGVRTLPGIEHFRKLSVYVLDGRVRTVRERIDIVPRLDQLLDLYDFPVDRKGSTDEIAAKALEALNKARATVGQAPVRERVVTVEVEEGAQPPNVTVPGDARQADLSVLVNRGRQGRTATPPSPTT